MLIIVDYRIPAEAITKLSSYGKVWSYKSNRYANKPLQGHPDIMICQTPKGLVLAPNIDIETLQQINDAKIPFIFGKNKVENEHPEISRYNAVVTEKITICNPKTVDPSILAQSANNTIISVKQSYNRCSTLPISDDSFITSDLKTHLKLLQNKCKSVLVNPSKITLEGYNHGLLGGCGGVLIAHKIVFFAGSLNQFSNKQEILDAISDANLEYIELFDERIIDVGGLFFMQKS